MSNSSPTTQHPHAAKSSTPQRPPARSHATNGRENRGLMYFFIGATVVALVVVLFFNFQGPERAARSGIADGPSRSSAGETTGGPSPAEGITIDRVPAPASQVSRDASSASGAENPARPASQAPDSQTPIGREAIGAPQGAAP